MKSYYIDSCIWLNLFKTEGDATKGKPYYQIAEDFVDKIVLSKNKELICSKIVFREIKFKLGTREFKKKKAWMIKKAKIRIVKITNSDVSFARELESALKYTISFYDCIHIALCERLGFILVTRDKELLRLAKRYVPTCKPEEL